MATTWNELLECNRKYSETAHDPQPYLSEFSKPPPQFLIFSCIDFRVPVERLLDIKTEDAFIIRNAGGRLKSSITDLLFLEALTKEQAVEDMIITHHTDCGLSHKIDENVKNELKAKAPNLGHEIDQLYFGAFGSGGKFEESIREDLKLLMSHPLIRQDIKDQAKGYVYDVKTSKLIPVPYEG